MDWLPLLATYVTRSAKDLLRGYFGVVSAHLGGCYGLQPVMMTSFCPDILPRRFDHGDLWKFIPHLNAANIVRR